MPNPVHFVHVGPLAQARRGGGRERPLTAKAPVRQTVPDKWFPDALDNLRWPGYGPRLQC